MAEGARAADRSTGIWWRKARSPLDGISLTIAAIDGDVIGVTIIPHTFANTTIGQARVWSRINIEVDVLAKHVEKLIASTRLG